MGLKIGITGGIGSGKSTVCRVFKVLGIPIYDADQNAKYIMERDHSVVSQIKTVFGEQSYLTSGELNRAYLSDTVFNNEERLLQLNNIVHPAVIKSGERWAKSQSTVYSLKEAALLFESGSYKLLDYIILVTAPEALRIQRVMDRDGVSHQNVVARMSKQWSDREKANLSDFTIVNDDKSSLIKQVLNLHHHFISL